MNIYGVNRLLQLHSSSSGSGISSSGNKLKLVIDYWIF